MSLFDPPKAPAAPPPLAERMRPGTIEDILGQDDLIAPGSALRSALDRNRLASMILWGPPGSGKTTLARLVARSAGLRFVAFSAVLSGIKEVKEVMAAAEREHRADGRPTLLFIDEIHRFNRAQQDAFLPHVEQGTILLIGATTENPSFAVNAALLSRCAVQVLKALSEEHLVSLLRRALNDPRGLQEQNLAIADAELRLMAARAGGDARRALNALEAVSMIVAGRIGASEGTVTSPVSRQDVDRALARATLLYDKAGEEHFNLISALHKSLRNSDADAALYWLARMLESGEDPLYVARRMIRFASEDVGNADPGALRVALSARDAFVSLGMPEGALALAQAAIYLAATPKSNSVYEAYGRVLEELRRGGAAPVPLALRNAPTALMRDLGHGRDDAYAHDEPEGTADLECLPERLRGRRFYQPNFIGHERALGERLQEMENRRAKKAAGATKPSPRSARTDE